MDDSKIIVKKIEEKYDRFLSNYAIDSSDFLALEEQSLLLGFVREHKNEGVYFYGGYEEAERRFVLFLPDYSGVRNQADIEKYFSEHLEDCPICILEVTVPPQEKVLLGHRDYLGALMGEGIKREKIGDIIVNPTGAQLIVKKELAEYLKENYRQIGRATVNTEIKDITDLKLNDVHKEEMEYNVSSPRLDNVVSAVFKLSRKNAVEAITRGLVFVNGLEVIKPGYSLKDGEKIVLRGRGKAIYVGVSGMSKKGKSYIKVLKYV